MFVNVYNYSIIKNKLLTYLLNHNGKSIFSYFSDIPLLYCKRGKLRGKQEQNKNNNRLKSKKKYEH